MPSASIDCTAPCGWSDDPAWSPDGRSILFQRGTGVGDAGKGVGTVDLFDLATRTVSTVYTGADTEYLYMPRWAPDGHRIVVELDRFASARLDESVVNGATVAVIDLDAPASPAVELVPDASLAVYPDWSPTGDGIVFQMPVAGSGVSGPSDLFVIDASGGSPRLLTTTGAHGRQALQPSWTPDGRIIFVEQDAMYENARMATINADGTGLASATGALDHFGTHPRLRPLP